MKKKKLKVFSIGAFCAVLLAVVVMPFSACTPIYQESDINQTVTLNLNPETDEVVAFTNGGIPIRSHALSGTETTTYQYITLGTYNGNPINWILVAVSDKGVTENVSPAGQAINSENDKDTVLGVVDSTLECGQVRLISECVLINEKDGFGSVEYTAYDQKRTSDWSIRYGRNGYAGYAVLASATAYHTQYDGYVNEKKYNMKSTTEISNDLHISSSVLCSVLKPTEEEYNTWLTNSTLKIAKEIGKNTPVFYSTVDFKEYAVVNDAVTNLTHSTDGTSNGSKASYSYTGTRDVTAYFGAVNTSGEYCTNEDTKNTAIRITLSSYRTGGWEEKKVGYTNGALDATYSGSMTHIIKNYRPIIIVDITKL